MLVGVVVALVGVVPAPARESHRCVGAGELRFRAADGTLLAGHRFGGKRANGRTAIVLAHQSEGSLCDWVVGARKLAAAGYFVIAFDFRGYGFSRGAKNPARYAGDYAAAVKTARALGATTVVLVGASMGGTAALVAGANIRPPVAGVVSLSGPMFYGDLDALEVVPRLTVPVLFAAAKDDNSFTDFPADARMLYEATASDRKELRIVPGSRHGITLFTSVQKLVEGFVRSL